MTDKISTATDVIDALGGPSVLARQLGIAQSTVSLWKRRGLPANWFDAINKLLSAKGLAAPPALFKMR